MTNLVNDAINQVEGDINLVNDKTSNMANQVNDAINQVSGVVHSFLGFSEM
jgi:hypothetical protein